MVSEETISKFRDGIFALRTRRFGTVAEIMVKHLFELNESHTLAFDKSTKEGKRVEVKFSTVLKENDSTINESNVIEQCLKANFANRARTCDEDSPFDCNIQQVKCAEFDIIYYGLFFADKVEVYKMTSEEIPNCPGYSNKQHRGNVGEGQFHLNNETIDWHRKNHLVTSLSYSDLYEML